MFLLDCSTSGYHRCYSEEKSSFSCSNCAFDHHAGIPIRCIVRDYDLEGKGLSRSDDFGNSGEILSSSSFGDRIQARILENYRSLQKMIFLLNIQ